MTRATARGALFAACILLILALVYEVAAPNAAPQIPSVPYHYRPLRTSLGRVRFLAPESSFDAVTKRSLFTPTRTESSDPNNLISPDGIGGILLVGVIIGGNGKMAIIREPGAISATATTLGTALRGYTVSEIEADHVILHGAQGDKRLALSANGTIGRAPPTNVMTQLRSLQSPRTTLGTSIRTEQALPSLNSADGNSDTITSHSLLDEGGSESPVTANASGGSLLVP